MSCANQQDLSYLNRDLSKVVMLDINEEHAALQPENAIIIKPWEGKGGDKGLVDLIPFLECTFEGFKQRADHSSHRHLQPCRRSTDPESVQR